MRLRILAAAVAIAFAISGGGCSWAFMRKAPAHAAAGEPARCTSAPAAPILDTICASYFVVNAAALAGATVCHGSPYDDPGCFDRGTRNAGIAMSLGIAGLCALSAGSGFGSASRCRAAKRGWTPDDRAPSHGGWRPVPEPADPPEP